MQKEGEFQASLGYIMGTRPAMIRWQDQVSKKMGRGDNSVVKRLRHKQHEDLVQIPRAQGDARWV